MSLTSKLRGWYPPVVIAFLGLTVAAARVAENRPADSLARPLSAIPMQLAGLQADGDRPMRDDVRAALAPTEYLSREYKAGSRTVTVFVAWYARQRAGETMHSPKNCLPGSGWEIWNHQVVTVGRDAINQYSIRRNSDRLATLYWYQSRDRVIASEYAGKILLLRDALTARSTAGAVVIVHTPDAPENVAAAHRLVAALIPQIADCFRR